MPTDVKVELVNRLVDAGLRAVEVTSFVSPKWVPQLADARDVLARVRSPPPDVRFSVLTPNMKVCAMTGCARVETVSECQQYGVIMQVGFRHDTAAMLESM